MESGAYSQPAPGEGVPADALRVLHAYAEASPAMRRRSQTEPSRSSAGRGEFGVRPPGSSAQTAGRKRSFPVLIPHPLHPPFVDLSEDVIQAPRDAPPRIMGSDLLHVADIALV